MREVDLLPDWLVEGLVEADEEEQKKHGGPERLWRKVDVGGRAAIVRSARKRGSVPIRRVT